MVPELRGKLVSKLVTNSFELLVSLFGRVAFILSRFGRLIRGFVEGKLMIWQNKSVGTFNLTFPPWRWLITPPVSVYVLVPYRPQPRSELYRL